MTGLAESRPISFIRACSSSLSGSMFRAPFPCSSSALTFLRKSTCHARDLSPFAALAVRSIRRSITSRSARMSSRSIVSISRAGSTLPSTWIMSSSSKQRTTWTTASTSRIWERNLFPRPSPLEAPLTSPAISTNSMVAGVILSGWYISASLSSRGSGTATTPTFGSMVQNA